MPHKRQRWRPNPVSSALEIWARRQAQKLVVLCVSCSLANLTHDLLLPLQAQGPVYTHPHPPHTQYPSEKLPQRLRPRLTLHPAISGRLHFPRVELRVVFEMTPTN